MNEMVGAVFPPLNEGSLSFAWLCVCDIFIAMYSCSPSMIISILYSYFCRSFFLMKCGCSTCFQWLSIQFSMQYMH